jgi:hypothetical protein
MSFWSKISSLFVGCTDQNMIGKWYVRYEDGNGNWFGDDVAYPSPEEAYYQLACGLGRIYKPNSAYIHGIHVDGYVRNIGLWPPHTRSSPSLLSSLVDRFLREHSGIVDK